MSYRTPLDDMLLSLNHGAGLLAAIEAGHYNGYDAEFSASVIEEAGKFGADVLEPLNRSGDREGVKLTDKGVITAQGWPAAYKQWTQAGWNAVSGPEQFGGQGLPLAIHCAVNEVWSATNLSFGLCPLLTMSAIDALHAHGSDELKNIYLAKLISGEWPGTMQLTEPQAGTDVGALRTRAEKQADGTYRLSGSKIFITYGDHDMSENIVHFVLARLRSAPVGSKGITLFLVPKFLVNADGSLGARNDIYASGIEHKLGIHASPTCTMSIGDKSGAVGYLVGSENGGMAAMFTMMNQARLAVGVQGVGISDRAYQRALTYAQDRKQGKARGSKGDGSDPIINYPDVKRNLMLMRGMTAAARTICYATAVSIDVSHRANDLTVRTKAAARGALLTPMAKAFSTDIANEVAAIGVQVHGGMGFMEETGAAQYVRDARILTIYEGTNGIQANDLLMRKLGSDKGEAVFDLLNELSGVISEVEASNDPAFGSTGAKLRDALGSVERTSKWLLGKISSAPNDALAGATPYLRLFSTTLGGCVLAKEALAARKTSDSAQRYVTLARFFAENITAQSGALESAVVDGADAINGADLVLLA